MKFYSQYNQDKWLYETYFKDKKNGVFLEIGADDGIDKSNTKFFEDTLNWTGMCIEPSPDRFKLLELNRQCVCENVAISNTVGSVEFLDISGWGKGLSGIVDKYDPKHKNRIQRELKHKDNKGHKYIKVKTEKISNLLHKHNIKDIDFCTIDTEGGEFDIIKSFDLDNCNIKVFVIENNYNQVNIKNYLESKGYKYVTKLKIDDVFVKTE